MRDDLQQGFQKIKRSIGKIGERLPKPQLQDKMGALKRKADKLDVKGILTYNPTQPTVSRLMGKYVVSPEGQWFPKKEESAMSQQGVFMAKQLRGEQLTPEESEENRRLTVEIGTEIGKGAGLAAPRAVDPSMYVNAEAIEAVNAGKEIPSKIGDFRVKWKATDGWRGYYDATPVKGSGWEKFDSDWVTGNWSDAGEHASATQEQRMAELYNAVTEMGGEMQMLLLPTSNVFSTGMDIFVKGVNLEQLSQFLR